MDIHTHAFDHIVRSLQFSTTMVFFFFFFLHDAVEEYLISCS